MPEIQSVAELAQRLIAEGYFDNEADARLAAVKIIHAAETIPPDDDAPRDDPRDDG